MKKCFMASRLTEILLEETIMRDRRALVCLLNSEFFGESVV